MPERITIQDGDGDGDGVQAPGRGNGRHDRDATTTPTTDVRRRDVMLAALKAAPVVVLLTARGARAQVSSASGASGGDT